MDVALLLLGLATLQPAADEPTGPLELSPRAAEPEAAPEPPAEPEPRTTVTPDPTAEVEPPDEPKTTPTPDPTSEVQPTTTIDPRPDIAAPASTVDPWPTEETTESSWSDEGPDVQSGDLYRRRGGFVAAAAGIANCGPVCVAIPVGGAGRFELGYRWGLVSLGIATSLAGAPYDVPTSDDDALVLTEESKGSLRMFGIGPFAQLNPAPRGRLDPFFAAGFEYHRFADVAKSDDGARTVKAKLWSHGPAVRLAVGLPVFLNERTTLGLRYDRHVPFSGAECFTIDGEALEDENKCRARKRDDDGLNKIDGRLVRRIRERPWSATLELRVSL